MNKISNIAFELSQDIYAISSDIDLAENQLHNFEITPEVYAKRLYVAACKIAYLQEVVDVVKKTGYKFANYVKEIEIINSINEIIQENLDMSSVGSLTVTDLRGVTLLTRKYQKIVPIVDMEDDLDDMEDDLEV